MRRRFRPRASTPREPRASMAALRPSTAEEVAPRWPVPAGLPCSMGPGQPFEIRELALPELEPGAVLVRVSLANVCGSDLHFWRGDAPLALPPDGWIFGHEMTGRVAAARGGGHDRLPRAAPPRGRPRGVLLLLPVRPLLRVPPRPARRVPPQDRPRDGTGRVPALGRRVRRVLLRPSGRLRVPRARRSARRARLPRELRSLAGALRPHAGRARVRRERRHPGRRRPRHPGGRGGARDGRRHGHRGRPGRRAARARPGVRRRPHAEPRRGPGPPRPRQAGARLDGRARRRSRVRLRRLPARRAGGHRDAALRRAAISRSAASAGAARSSSTRRRSSGARRPSSASSCTTRG